MYYYHRDVAETVFFMQNGIYVNGNELYIKYGKGEEQFEIFKRKKNEKEIDLARILGRIETWAEENEMAELLLKTRKIYKKYLKFDGYITLWKN